MAELEYPCPFKPGEKCTCSSEFAQSIYKSTVNGIIGNGIRREDAIKMYIDYINEKPILPIEAPKFSKTCVWSNSVFIELKKKN